MHNPYTPTVESQAIAQAAGAGDSVGQFLLATYPAQPCGDYYQCVPDSQVQTLVDCIAAFAAELLCVYHGASSERECTAEEIAPAALAAVQEWSYSNTMAEYGA
jgi:hypothetical protein